MSERRHRISESELGPVTEAIEHELRALVQTRANPYAAEQLFHLWWRIMIHREGRPDYPPFTWGTVEDHLGAPPIMVPKNEVR